jgi:hypothetical protein
MSSTSRRKGNLTETRQEARERKRIEARNAFDAKRAQRLQARTIAACGIPFTIIMPAKWKPAVGVPTGADKEASRLRALQLFPANLARKKDHARSDAMLLAYFGMKVGAL